MLRRAFSVGTAAAVKAAGKGPARQMLKLAPLAPSTSALGPNDVAIKMLVAPIHPVDIHMVENASSALPAFFGVEGLAEVSDVGSGVKSLGKGDWVVPQLGFGKEETISLTPDCHKLPLPPPPSSSPYPQAAGEMLPLRKRGSL